MNRDPSWVLARDEELREFLRARGLPVDLVGLRASVQEMERADLERRVVTLTANLHVMLALIDAREVNTVLDRIMHAARFLIDADRCSLFLVDAVKHELYAKIAHGMGDGEIRFSMNVGIAGHSATTGEAVNLSDAYEDPRFNQEVDRGSGYRTRQLLCVPMRDTNNSVVGVVQALNRLDGRPFTQQDQEVLILFARSAAAALWNARTHEILTAGLPAQYA